MMTHRGLVHEYVSGIHALEMGEGDEPLHAMPLYHSAEMQLFMLPYLAVGATNHLMEAPDVPEILRRIEADRIGALFLAPTVWVPAVNHADFATRDLVEPAQGVLRRLDHAGAVLAAAARAAARRSGSTTASASRRSARSPPCWRPRSTTSAPTPAGARCCSSSCGSSTTTATTSQPGGSGEVVYRSPQLCEGYWDKPEETAEAFRDGWFHSGDLVRIDEQGYITVVDRIKDVINTGGVLVASREVEDALYTPPGGRRGRRRSGPPTTAGSRR